MTHKLKTNLMLSFLAATLAGLVITIDQSATREMLPYMWALRFTIAATVAFFFIAGNRQRRRLLQIVEQTDDIVSWATPEGQVQYINSAGIAMFGLHPGEPLNHTIRQLHPKWAAELLCGVGIPYAKEHGTWRGNTAIVTTNGVEIPTTQVVICHGKGRNRFISTVIRDARKEYEEAQELIRRSNDLQAIIDNGMIGLAVVDDNNTVVYINDMGAKIMHSTKDKIVGLDFGYRVITTGTPSIIQTCDESGELSDAELIGTEITWSGKRMHLAMFRDISQVRKMGELTTELEEARKRENAAVIAGGVAHDLNNILTAILGLPELISKRVKDQKALEMLEHIRASGERASAIVGDMLMVSRPSLYTLEPLRLRAVVQGYVNSPEHRKLIKRYPWVTVVVNNTGGKELGVNGSYVHLYKALMNVVKNAFEAIPSDRQGEVVISSGPEDVRQTLKGVFSTVEPGSYMTLSIKDNGTGIEPQNMMRVFDAFFTCKKANKTDFNSGLGLTVVKTVADRHGAGIVLNSTAGVGTKLTFYFKVIEYKVRIEVPQEDISGTGRILVLDDVEEQLYVARAILQDLGYEVDTSSTPDDFIEKGKAHTYDAVIVDAKLNGHGSGIDAWNKFRQQTPGQRGVMVSGNLTDKVKEDATKAGMSDVMQKPFTRLSLGKCLRDLLRAKP
jgi:PAS domain S-box-containing protein